MGSDVFSSDVLRDIVNKTITTTLARIIPPGSGFDALEVRTFDGRENFKISEDGYVKVWDGSAFQNALRFNRATGNVEIARGILTGSLLPDSDNARDLGSPTLRFRTGYIVTLFSTYMYPLYLVDVSSRGVGGRQYGTRYILDARGDLPFQILSMLADSVNTLRHARVLLRSAYWTGTASADRDALIVHRMLSSVPTSEIAFQIAGVDYMRVGDRGVKLDKVVFDPGTSVSVDAEATYTLPAGAYYVNLGPNTVAEVYDDIAGAWVTVIPTGGKGIVVSDGSNARLRNTGTVAESSNIRRVL